MTGRTLINIKTVALAASVATVTWFITDSIASFKDMAARMWLISMVKVPLRNALVEVQQDIHAGRHQSATAKLDVLVEEAWAFDQGTHALKGPGLGGMERLRQIEDPESPLLTPLSQLHLTHQQGAHRYELRILSNREAQHAYQLGFFEQETNTRRGLAETLQGGVMTAENAAETLTALWHPSGTVVAFNDRATKHTLELYVYAIQNGNPVRLDMPDHIQNALGRIGATDTGIHCLSTPLEWTDDLLTVKLHFSVVTPAKGLLRYDTVATFRLESGRLRLQTVAQPRPSSLSPDQQ